MPENIKTNVYIGTSLDGFIARKDGAIDWLDNFVGEDIVTGYEEFIHDIDAIVIGRGTYEKVLSFPEWPYSKKVFVLSSSIRNVPVELKEKAEVLSMTPKKVLHYLSSLGFKNLYVDGGKVIQSFLKYDLIDEMIITKIPKLIGEGIPLFGSLKNDLEFEHIKTVVLSCGLVKSYYKRKR